MDKMCIKFKKKYNLSIFQKDRLDSHVDNHVEILGGSCFFFFIERSSKNLKPRFQTTFIE